MLFYFRGRCFINRKNKSVLSATQKIPKPLKGLGIRNAGDGGLPRANQQSTGLLVLAHLRPKSRRFAPVGLRNAPAGAVRCRRPVRPLSTRNKKQPPDRDTVRGQFFMPVMGVEPIRCHHQRILSPSRLPIPTHRHRKLFYYSGSFAKSQDTSWASAAFFAGTVVFCGPGVYNLSCIILFKM